MTIQQIQARIDSGSTNARELINMIADYLQANPGGGGLTLYNGDGSLAGDRVVDLDGHTLDFNSGGNSQLFLNPGDNVVFVTGVDGTANTYLQVKGKTGDNVSFTLSASDPPNTITVVGDAIAQTIALTAANGVIINGVQEFADNAAAVTGGLAVGTIYRTGDVMKIVH